MCRKLHNKTPSLTVYCFVMHFQKVISFDLERMFKEKLAKFRSKWKSLLEQKFGTKEIVYVFTDDDDDFLTDVSTFYTTLHFKAQKVKLLTYWAL